jgi:hypothetical protein
MDIIHSCAAHNKLHSVPVSRLQAAKTVFGSLPIPMPVVTGPDAMSVLTEVPLFREQAWSC